MPQGVMILTFCHLLLWFSCLSLSGHANPGVKMRVSQKWLDYVRTMGMDVIHHMLLNDYLPDIAGSTRMFGNVDYVISRVLIEEFDIPKSTAVTVPPTDVQVNIENAYARVYGNWHVTHWLIKDSGTFTLQLSGISVGFRLTTFQDSSDRPSVFLFSCHSEITQAKVHLYGGASWLYNLFTVFLEKPIQTNVNKKLCPKVSDAITILQHELATFHVNAQCDGAAEISYSLITPPMVEWTHIDLALKGIAHPVGSPAQEALPIHPIALPEGKGSMIYVGLSEHFFNSLGKTYFMSNVLNLTLSQEQYPDVFWLRTGDYGAIIPQMNKYYPESQAMILTITATRAPVVRLTPMKLSLELTGRLQALAVLPYIVTKEVFSVDLTTTLIADTLHISDLNLAVYFVSESLKFYVFNSSVGRMDTTALERTLEPILKESVQRKVNVLKISPACSLKRGENLLNGTSPGFVI
ncbi:bactericidal permeability-increasing protein-like [Discoglossus pictus]